MIPFPAPDGANLPFRYVGFFRLSKVGALTIAPLGLSPVKGRGDAGHFCSKEPRCFFFPRGLRALAPFRA